MVMPSAPLSGLFIMYWRGVRSLQNPSVDMVDGSGILHRMVSCSNSPGSWSTKTFGVYLFCICIGTCGICGLGLSVAQILI